MSGRLRTWLFWLHLAVGVVIALAVVPMAVTGMLMSFERELLGSFERDARVLDPGTAPLPPSELLRRSNLEPKPDAMELRADRTAPVLLQSKAARWLVDPYDGHVVRRAKERELFHSVEQIHRSVALEFLGAHELGTTIAGIAAIGMLLLSLSGPLLWWPRKPSRAQLRKRVWFAHTSTAMARDFHWHHVFGIWCTPVILAASVTGILLAFDPARDVVTSVLGKAGKARLELDADVATREAVRLAPDFATLRLRWSDEGALSMRVGYATGTRPTHFAAVEQDARGAVALRRYEAGKLGDRVLGWARWLHTGQALGVVGQAWWALGLGGVLGLVWTGVALSVRRVRRSLKARSKPRAGSSDSLRSA